MFNTENSQSSLSSIRQKRMTFAKQIRRNQLEQIFKERRKSNFPHLMGIEIITPTNLDFKQLIKNVQMSRNQAYSLEQILSRLNSPNQNYVTLVYQIINSGIYAKMLENLDRHLLLDQTLKIFSFILSKENLVYGCFFVSKGLLEQLLELMPLYSNFTPLILNILQNLCIEDYAFSQIILQNNKHKDLFIIFNKFYQLSLENKLPELQHKSLKGILNLLSIMVQNRQIQSDYSRQYDQILDFCCYLLSRGIFVSQVLIVIYQLAIAQPQKVQTHIYSIVNEILKEETGQSPFYQSLLVLVKHLTPGRFDYGKIFNIALMVKYDLQKYTIQILYKLKDEEPAFELAKMEHWWERMLIKINPQNKQFGYLVTIIRKLKVNYECIWRFISWYFQELKNNDTTIQILILLRNSFIDVQQVNSHNKAKFLDKLQKNKIPLYLEKLTENQNYTISSKSEELLGIFHLIKNNLKEQYSIDVQL